MIDASVVIASHNRRELLRDTLESISGGGANDVSHETIVVVDDGSTDGSDAVVQEWFDKLRDEAVKNVWNAGGVELIKNLVDQVSHAGLVGFHLLSHLNDENAVIEMIEQTSHGTDKEKFFARCVSGSAYDKFGNSWAQLLL